MKSIDLKGKSRVELEKTLADNHERLRQFRSNISGSKIKNVREGRLLRRDIARIHTVLNKTNV